MTANIIEARNLSKRYGKYQALKQVNLDVPSGSILGLVGPNGAGKSTLLKAVLGLTPYEGELNVLGMAPNENRSQLLEDVVYIADTAILPRWIKVSQVIDYVAGVHPKFDPELAKDMLSKTKIPSDKKVGKLSKGMVTQLHLALVMAIDAKLLVLDEPTLGLDIIYCKHFYQTLLNEYFDGEKTIIITTHQIKEVESILTHTAFIQDGAIMLSASMEEIQEDFVEVSVKKDTLDDALSLKPIAKNKELGGYRLLFRGVDKVKATSLGQSHIPSLSDIFIALMENNTGEVA